MRGKSSPKQGSSKAVMDTNKVEKLDEEPHLSGAYIRNLVKQLTSTRSKDPLSTEEDENPDGEGLSSANLNSVENGGKEESQSQQPPKPQQHKKQVRRRLHTSKPYQERLLNMAEARREIVTALKFHRASMKQQQQQQPELEMQETHQLQQGKSKSKRNSRTSASNYDNHFSSYGGVGGDHLSSSYSSAFNSCPFSYPYYPWPLPSVTTPPLFHENLHLPLPNQPLGLNLNFQDFNIDSTMFSSTTSPSSSSSPPMCFPVEEVPTVGITHEVIPMVCGNNYDESNMVNISEDLGFHYAMDDKELAEIRLVGEQHQIEWNDTMNLVNSAWWSKFLKSMEIEPQEDCEVYGKLPFDEIVEFPSWLNSNESLLEDCLGDYCSDDYMKDAALPCMEIEEMEGIDGDWLSS